MVCGVCLLQRTRPRLEKTLSAPLRPPLPLQELDPQLFEECRRQWEDEQQQQRGREEQRQRQWADVTREASKRATARGLPNGSVNESETYTPLLIRSR